MKKRYANIELSVEEVRDDISGLSDWVWVRTAETDEEVVCCGGTGADDSDVDSETRLLVRALRLERERVKRQDEEAEKVAAAAANEVSGEQGGDDSERAGQHRLKALGVCGPLNGPMIRGRLLQR